MSGFDFDDILDTKVDEIERPPMLPKGTYVAAVKGFNIDREKADFDIVNFNCVVVRPEAVDDDDMKAFGGNPAGQPFRISFLYDKNDEVRRRQTADKQKRFMVEHCAVSGKGKTNKQLMPETVNAQFLAHVDHRPDKTDPEVVYIDVRKTAPLD